MAVGRRKIIGVTQGCIDGNSILSAISFQGTIKIIIKAILSGIDYIVTDIKDRMILGKLPLIGTGLTTSKHKKMKLLQQPGS